MKLHQAKHVILVAGVTVVIAVATARVWIAIAPRPNPGSVQEAISRSVANAAPPDYDATLPATDNEGLSGRAAEAVRASLLKLPLGERPPDRDATAIARVFADFLVLNRTGNPEHALESYRARGLEAPRQLQNPDPENRMRSWAYSTAWARHAELELDAVTTQLAYLKGQKLGPPPPGGGHRGIAPPPFRRRDFQHQTCAHRVRSDDPGGRAQYRSVRRSGTHYPRDHRQ